jgi:anthranilate synthase component II
MKLLIIDNNDSFTYNLVQIIKQFRNCTFEVKKNDLINMNSVNDFQKILFTPGPGVPKDFPAMFEILDRYSSIKSILGVCLGHQAIAEHRGAVLKNSKTVFHGISKKIQIVQDDLLFKNLPAIFDAGLYHSWYVSNDGFPECLDITSYSEDGIIMSFKHKKNDVRGVQFHPESIMTQFGKVIIRNWLES